MDVLESAQDLVEEIFDVGITQRLLRRDDVREVRVHQVRDDVEVAEVGAVGVNHDIQDPDDVLHPTKREREETTTFICSIHCLQLLNALGPSAHLMAPQVSQQLYFAQDSLRIHKVAEHVLDLLDCDSALVGLQWQRQVIWSHGRIADQAADARQTPPGAPQRLAGWQLCGAQCA